jgi:hypothetical protein
MPVQIGGKLPIFFCLKQKGRACLHKAEATLRPEPHTPQIYYFPEPILNDMNIVRLFFAIIAVITTVMFAMVLRDIFFPQTIYVDVEPEMIQYPEIHPMDTFDYTFRIGDWYESAWSLGLSPDTMTIEQFLNHNGLLIDEENLVRIESFIANNKKPAP